MPFQGHEPQEDFRVFNTLRSDFRLFFTVLVLFLKDTKCDCSIRVIGCSIRVIGLSERFLPF